MIYGVFNSFFHSISNGVMIRRNSQEVAVPPPLQKGAVIQKGPFL